MWDIMLLKFCNSNGYAECALGETRECGGCWCLSQFVFATLMGILCILSHAVYLKALDVGSK